MDDEKKVIEAALFMAAKPIALAELYQVVKIPKPRIRKIIEDMKKYYENHSLHIVESEGMYEMRVRSGYEKYVEHLAPHQDFSKAILQTLSLITYKNPVKQSDIIKVRGNRAYDHLKELEAKRFIRREASGHTNLVYITRKFLDYFGLENAEELKKYFGATPIDKVLRDVEIKKEVVAVEKEKIAIDSRDIAISANGLPPKLQEIVEKKKEDILNKRKLSEGETKSEETPLAGETSETTKKDNSRKFKSSFDDVIDE
ncbi:MAG: SMC-Scp complex subunit ScpB [archaeon]|nr:SMC-Scp complex subunit ScpB [archaeon]